MIGVRKLSPGGYEYLTGSVACGDGHELEAGESLSDYYVRHGYPPGRWFGQGAAELGVSGEVTAAQMNALFGEGRHPDADRILAEKIAEGATEAEALAATKLGRRFYQYKGADELRSRVIAAYKQHNRDLGRPATAPIDDDTRPTIRRAVQTQAFAEAHEGRQPTEDELRKWLSRHKREMKSATAGFELVFAPPKSVSVLWALGDQATSDLVAEIHRQAVHDTLTHLEQNVAYTRRGNGGYAQHDVKGIAAAIFEHWDSRAGDPHLHTHVPISTKVKNSDGTWTALDGRTILAASVTMSEYYNSRVRDLFRDQGASWTQRGAGGIDLKRPTWELDGVPNELLAGFSQRAAKVEQERARQIVKFRREHGCEPSPKDVLEISRRAQYETRRAKLPPRLLTAHKRFWRSMSTDMVAPDVAAELGSRVLEGEDEPLATIDLDQLAATVIDVVSDHYSHFNSWNLLAEAHRQTAGMRVAPGTRERLVDDILRTAIHSGETVALEAPSVVDEPVTLRRKSGESVFVEHNSQRYTTHRTLREEAALAEFGRLRDGQKLAEDTVWTALNEEKKLNPGQRNAVISFARSGARVQLLYAPAGAGKTTAMRVYSKAVRADGGRVFAFGPSARAAKELATSIDAHPHTLHQLTTAQRLGSAERYFAFRRGDVLIIDEVSMAGTHTLHDVVAYALAHDADVRLVGDGKQLAAVEAGGAVRWFEHRNGAVRLNEVVRFADPAQAAASMGLRDGDIAALDYYFAQRWVESGSRETMRDTAHRNWRADLDAGLESLLVVPSNEDVAALNLEARALRVERGDVSTRRSVQLHDGTTASRGDWIVTRSNDRLKTLFAGRDFVKNGDSWDLMRVRRDGSIKVRHHESGGTIVLPAEYVAEHVELRYAATVNTVQGMTSHGSSHGLVDPGMSLEQLYPQSTRARHENRMYVITHEHTIDSHQETPLERSARDVLVTVMGRSSAETAATEELRASQNKSESLRTLVRRHDYVAQLGVESRIDRALERHAPELLDCPAAPALRQTLMTAEALGWQAEKLVPTALRSRSLGDADDAAAVMQWRIQGIVAKESPPLRDVPIPDATTVNRWRSIVERFAPDIAVEEPCFNAVWERAAAATAEGFDADAALTYAAKRLTERPASDPMPDARFTTGALDDAIARQRTVGGGWQPALPWLARPDHAHLAAGDRSLPDYLDRLNTAIAARTDQLRAVAIAEQPDWTAALGPRPLHDVVAAEHWDRLAGLGAAFRDTYDVTSDDPRYPLGEEPEHNGLKARAWRTLISQWHPYDPPSAAPNNTAAEPASVLDRIRAKASPQHLEDALATELAVTEPREQRLGELVYHYGRGVRAAHDDLRDIQIEQVLAERAPQVFGADAEDALWWQLRRAHELGWTAEQVIPDVGSLRNLDRARDPAAVLFRLVQQRVDRVEPPDGPRQHATGPLPWLDAPDPAALASRPGLAEHLERLAEQIAEHVDELHTEVAISEPGWTTGLGPRSGEPLAAQQWDNLAATAAAYRKIYNIRTIGPATPIGPQPAGDGPRAHAWSLITDNWKSIVASRSEQSFRNDEAIAALRERADDLGAGYEDETENLTAGHAAHRSSDVDAEFGAVDEQQYLDDDAATDELDGLRRGL